MHKGAICSPPSRFLDEIVIDSEEDEDKDESVNRRCRRKLNRKIPSISIPQKIIRNRKRKKYISSDDEISNIETNSKEVFVNLTRGNFELNF